VQDNHTRCCSACWTRNLLLLHRVVQPVCLGSWHSNCTATAAAGLRLSTPSGAQHPARQLLARCAAAEADGSQHGGVPQQQRAEAAEAAAKLTAPKRARSGSKSSKSVPWNADVEAAVLQFWMEQGALLPEAEVQPEQQAEQQRMRSRILRWAAKHSRHRDLQFLTDYMAKLKHAAADSAWADDPWRIALHSDRLMLHPGGPTSLLQRMQTATDQLAQHGVRITLHSTLRVAVWCGEAAGDRAIKLMLALQHLPISLDNVHVVAKAPNLMHLNNLGAVLERRVAAMQQLHPQLDVAKLCNAQPILLVFTKEKLAANWASLQRASGLGDDDMRALVESHPGVLTRDVGVVAWKVQQVRAYDVARESAAVGCRTPASGLARVVPAASFRVWRLCYLSGAMNVQYAAETWVKMGEANFVARNPGYSSWLASNPIPAEAFKD
jgi:hypothetical protein